MEKVFIQTYDRGCWLWLGCTVKGDYGSFHFGKHSQAVSAHRFSWMAFNGEIPQGLCVLHSCDNPGCVRPEHLFLGTKAVNNNDRDSKGRTARGESNGKSILTASDVKMIRALRAKGLSGYRIIRTLGLSAGAVYGVIQNRTWRQVT